MANEDAGKPEVALDTLGEDERRYSLGLRVGVRVALVMLVAAFATYAFGLLEPHIPMSQLPDVWRLPATEFIEETGMPTGWGWTARLHQGDVFAILPAVFLAALTGFCMLAVLPVLIRRRDWIYVVILLIQLGLFIVAALPGVGGGH
jgi:hypothetical protein